VERNDGRFINIDRATIVPVPFGACRSERCSERFAIDE
jgi:hypothetical protein